MKRVAVPFTFLGLAWAATGDATVRPFLIANSVVGFMYCLVERKTIASRGARLFEYTFPISLLAIDVSNVLFHVVLPLTLRLDRRPVPTPLFVAAVYCSALTVLDLNAVYPTEHAPLSMWIALHAAAVAISALTSVDRVMTG